MSRDGVIAGEETTPGTATPAGYVDVPSTARDVGSIVAGDYRIEGRLGVGGMGVVYLARHTALDRQVALKELLSVSAEGRERLLREAMAMAKVDHPNVVRVFDARQSDGHLFIAMEYIPGGTLAQWCASRRRSVKAIVGAFAEAAKGLAAAHAKGIVHRDFKPHNVLMSKGGHARVADFGIARSATATGDEHPGASQRVAGTLDSDLTATGSMLGTPAYMAPEQYDGRADARSDQFAFCVALYEALYGQRPYDGDSPAVVWAQKSRGEIVAPRPTTEVPEAVFEVLRRGLHPDPGQRFADLPALVRQLRRASASRAPLIAALVGASVLAMGVVGLGGWWWATRDRPSEVPASSADPIPFDPAPRLAEDVGIIETDDDGPAFDLGPGSMSLRFPPLTRPEEAASLSEPIVCDQEMVFENVGWDGQPHGPMLIARHGCVFVCRGCTLFTEKLGIVASGNAVVEFTDGKITARRGIAKIRGRAHVSLHRTELFVPEADTAVQVEEGGILTLEDLRLNASECVRAKDEATVRLIRTTLRCGSTTLDAGAGTLVQEKRAQYLLITPQIRGRREAITPIE